MANAGQRPDKQIVQGQPSKDQASAPQTAQAASRRRLDRSTRNHHEVQSGDTLAVIARRNCKHASPRLLDEICRANGMRNANVLSLGQKITLPNTTAQPVR